MKYSHKQFKVEIKNFLKENKVAKTFYLLDNTLQKDSSSYDELVLLQARYNERVDRNRKGISSSNGVDNEINKIISDALEIVNKLKDSDIKNQFYKISNRIHFIIHDEKKGEDYTYVGEMRNGLPNGEGVVKYESGKKITGHFINGEKINKYDKNLSTVFDGTKIGNSIKTLVSILNKLQYQPLRLALVEVELNNLSEKLLNLDYKGVFNIAGNVPQARIQDVFQQYIEILKDGDQYNTISNLDFWSKRTFTDPIDFLDANVAASKRGVRINRVIILDRKYSGLDLEEKVMLKRHRAISENGNITTKVAFLRESDTLESVSNIATVGGEENQNLLVEVLFEGGSNSKRVFKDIVINTNSEKIIREERRFERWYSDGEDIGVFLEKNKEIKRYTFTCKEIESSNKFELVSIEDNSVTENAWNELFKNIKRENQLVTYPLRELKERWEKHEAGIVLLDDEIISYVSVLKIFSRKNINTISDQLNGEAEINNYELFEFQTGWTKEEYRQKRLNLSLRSELKRQHGSDRSCFLSLTCGYSSSPLAYRMGWTVIPWTQFPYVTEFIGWFNIDESLYYKGGLGGRLSLHGKEPYNGDKIDSYSFDKFKQDYLEKYFLLWVENPYIFKQLNNQISDVVNDDIVAWRNLIR